MNNNQMIIRLPIITTIKNIETKVYSATEFTLYFDGCSKGNPGPSGIGTVIYKNGQEYWAACRYLGPKKTNNEAEYSALILGLQAAIKLGIKSISVCGDSLLVINQVNKLYKVKNLNLSEFYDEVVKLTKQFTYIDFNHVYRKNNKRADQLSNQALQHNNQLVSETKIIDDIIEEIKDLEE